MLLALCVGSPIRSAAVHSSLTAGAARARKLTALAKEYAEIPSFAEVVWPEEWPFADPRYFARADESPDGLFYEQPRFVTHIDDGAIGAITDYYLHTMYGRLEHRFG